MTAHVRLGRILNLSAITKPANLFNDFKLERSTYK